LGDVVVGPIPYTPTTAAAQGWEGFDLADFGDVPFFGDTEGTPAPFFVGFVKNDALPHILSDDASARGYQYSWFGGPWTDNLWGGYSSSIPLEYMMRVAVTYPFGASPSVGGLTILPETYQGNQDFTVSATITDESAITEARLWWNVNDPSVPGVEQSVEMTADEGDVYTGVFNPSAGIGDTVYYFVSATDDDENTTVVNPLSPNNFSVIEPLNPDAEILLVLDNAFIDPADWYDFDWEVILSTLGYTYETWDVGAMRGIDRFTTNYGWSDGIVVAAWGVSVIPTRSYDAMTDPFASYLNAGGNLFFTDQDYFFGNGEVAEPTFVSGDFAFDFFSLSGGANDPGDGVGPDTMIIGAEGDITDFMSGDFVPMRPDDWVEGANWTDYITLDAADFIMTSETGEDVGGKYDNGTFKTVYYAFPVEAMNDVTTGWSDSTMGAWDANFVTLLQNSFEWLGFEPSASAIDDEQGIVVERFSLEQNYPNPFNPTTEIAFRLARAVDVDLAVYSITGQKVRTLANGYHKAGKHSVTWNGLNDSGNRVASGVYFYSIEAGDFTAFKKMVLIK
jgi:hypothetical protein